jgi:hypothetical protein
LADEQKPQSNQSSPPEDKSASSISPAPTDFDSGPKKAGDNKPAEVPKVQTEPLADGTVPTVLNPGESHRSVPKGKATLDKIYRKADIMTTLLTFAGVAVASLIVLGGYAYFSGQKGKPTPTPKVSSLSSTDLKNLDDFFNGNTSGTGSSQVLTISSPSLFNSRVAVGSDLKVTGGISVDGPTALGGLTVDQQSTLGVTDIRGQLTVAGPVNLQSPATLGGGGTVTGNLAVSGNGSFGGSISAGVINVANLSVSGTLNLNGHLSIGGRQPSTTTIPGISSSAQVQGDDSAGSVTVSVPAHTFAGGGVAPASLATVNFSSGYSAVPIVVITPVGSNSAAIEPYVSATANSFTIGAAALPNSAASGAQYAFNYFVVLY